MTKLKIRIQQPPTTDTEIKIECMSAACTAAGMEMTARTRYLSASNEIKVAGKALEKIAVLRSPRGVAGRVQQQTDICPAMFTAMRIVSNEIQRTEKDNGDWFGAARMHSVGFSQKNMH